MKTAAELIQYIKDENLEELFFSEEDLNEELTAEQREFLGKVELKDYTCNSDEMYSVIHLEDHNVFLKLEGEYDSYGGGEHDYYQGINEVKPEQQTITIYK